MTDYTRAERRRQTRMIQDLQEMDRAVELAATLNKLVPGEWLVADSRAPCEPRKDRVTLRIDRDVLAWYRKLGRGYQGRMNLVLRAYMDGIVSRSVKDLGAFDWQGREL